MDELAKIGTTNMSVTSPTQESALARIAGSREVTEAQAAVMVAKRFPRNERDVLDRILIATQRPKLAEVSAYSYSKGGTEIQGPSIKLAQELLRIWGNSASGVRELESGPTESVLEAWAIDYETNVRCSKIFTVKHERTAKGKTYQLTESRERYENLANFGSRRLRACILSLIPPDIVEYAMEQCEETLKSKADTSPEAIKKMVDAFGQFNVSKEQIEKRIQRRIDSITPAQVIGLRKVFNSLKDGMSSPSDWFEPQATEEQQATPEKPKSGSDALKSALRGKKKEAQQQEQPSSEKPIDKPELAPGECPNSPGDIMTVEYCSKCGNREGCPTWE